MGSRMVDLHNLTKIREDFQEIFKDYGEVVIAGGSVRDALMEKDLKDVDIFVLSTNYKAQKKELERLLIDYPKAEIKLEWHKSEPFLVDTIMYNDLEVQLLSSPYKNAEELMDSFDWNICMFAIDSNGLKKKCEIEEIGYGKFLKLHRVTYPYSTLRRGYRFSERFGMRLRKKDVKRICEAIVGK